MKTIPTDLQCWYLKSYRDGQSRCKNPGRWWCPTAKFSYVRQQVWCDEHEFDPDGSDVLLPSAGKENRL